MQTYAPPPPPSRTRPRRAEERPEPVPPKKRDPLWAKLAIIFGAVIMAVGGAVVVVPKIAAQWATSGITQIDAIPTELLGKNINGSINFLLLGLDQRNGEEAEDRIRADSIMIVHIPATHDRVFMISLPRDAEVAIPDYPKTNFHGFRDKINAAFAFGAVTPDGHRDPSPDGRARGTELTIKTINNLVPGGMTFNGAAVINFDGFQSVLDAIGGVNMCVDEETWSIHYKNDGTRAPIDLNQIYSQSQGEAIAKHYVKECRDMLPWEALDYSRQRYWLADGDSDYGRQRHQQQLIKAIVNKVSSGDTLTNFSTITKLRKAAGDLLTMDLGNTKIEDWVLTLSSLRSQDIVMIKTNGGKFAPNGNGSNETLLPDSLDLLKAVQDDTVFDFLTTHQDWIAADQ
jgi:anionic cell wall polymer biosynthesis LytR-Cps2A-Psr (LCP) family protein